MKRKILRELRLGTLVRLQGNGKIYLFNGCARGKAVFLEKNGKEKLVDLLTDVFYYPESEGITFWSDWKNQRSK